MMKRMDLGPVVFLGMLIALLLPGDVRAHYLPTSHVHSMSPQDLPQTPPSPEGGCDAACLQALRKQRRRRIRQIRRRRRRRQRQRELEAEQEAQEIRDQFDTGQDPDFRIGTQGDGSPTWPALVPASGGGADAGVEGSTDAGGATDPSAEGGLPVGDTWGPEAR